MAKAKNLPKKYFFGVPIELDERVQKYLEQTGLRKAEFARRAMDEKLRKEGF